MSFGFVECYPNGGTMGKVTHGMSCDHSEGVIDLPGKGEGSLEERALNKQNRMGISGRLNSMYRSRMMKDHTYL